MNSGDSIGPYVVHSDLGTGGMGKVYRARDTRLGRDVALKQLSDPSLTSELARERVLREARAAAGLSHPNIATIYDVLDTPEGPTIVMEYVPGESLARRIARGSLPTVRALEIGVQIAEGLAAAHARGIVHRDLKPANIQITPDGKAKILDFGIAQLSASHQEKASTPTVTSYTEAGHLAGTPGYMAPEQLGGGRADERTDIYALGVLLYEMLTGRSPYPAGDLLTSAMAVLRGGAPAVSDLVPSTPPLVSAIVERAMAKEPDDRFQTASELARELKRERRLLAGERAGSLPARVLREQGALRMALVALAAVILAAAGWQWLRYSNGAAVSARSSVLAVLPFTNATGEEVNDPIAIGLTDGVAHRLSALQSVRVLSLDQSREAYTGAANAPAAARALGAGFVVEGSLRRTGQTLDVDVSLVTADGQKRRAGNYTGSLAQIFDLHQRIAQGVIAALTTANAVPPSASTSASPTTNQEAYADYQQARLYLQRADDVDHAITLFERAIAKDARFALAYAGLGQAYWLKYQRTNDAAWTTKATKAILDAVLIDPDRPEVRLSLAVMHQGVGDLKAAEEELRFVIARQPWNDDAYRLLAGVYIDRSQWDAAVEELKRAIELRPHYWRNYSELGYAHYRAGRNDEAVRAYQRVVELQPDSASGYAMLGTAHQSAGRLDEALQNFAKSNALRPRVTTHSNIGTIHYWRGNYAKAAEAYQAAIELAPNAPIYHANLGDALQKLGRREAARASYRTAVEKIRQQLAVNDNDGVAHALLALYLAKLEDRSGAETAAAKALAMSPDDGEVLYNAAMVDALVGRTALACGRLGQALAKGASQEFARRADELRILKGCTAYDQIVRR